MDLDTLIKALAEKQAARDNRLTFDTLEAVLAYIRILRNQAGKSRPINNLCLSKAKTLAATAKQRRKEKWAKDKAASALRLKKLEQKEASNVSHS